MFTAISIAANGLATQSKRIEAVARQIASMGETPAGETRGHPARRCASGRFP